MAGARDYFSLIKFSHSIFALPFALIAFLVAQKTRGVEGEGEALEGGFPWPQLGLLILCMVFARAAAMAYNRYVDRQLDAENPRTAGREIPSGKISPAAALLFTRLCALAFLLSAFLLSTLCLLLAGPVLLVLCGYSHAKRFTSLSHFWLGLSLGLAPPAAWVAARDSLDASLLQPAILGLGVLFWVAGFDIIYACQDESFDRARGLHSLPARLGIRVALRISAGLHVLVLPLFLYFGILGDAGLTYHGAVAALALILLLEHLVISPGDLSAMGWAFPTLNGVVSLGLLGATMVDLYWVSWFS